MYPGTVVTEFVLCFVALGAFTAVADKVDSEHQTSTLPSEILHVEQLGRPSAHWVIVNDMNFVGLMDSKVYIVDADAGTMLGMLSTGGLHTAVEVAPDQNEIYSAETYYSRGTRGSRTDVISAYDTSNLSPVGEVVIPAKRASGMPHRSYTGISDDGRFVYVANMTPATSISIADVRARTFVEEVSTPGCTLVYPTGNREFGMLCGDGTFLLLQLDTNGHVISKHRSEAFFDPEADPVTEKAVRYGDTWLFVSFAGVVHPITVASGNIQIQPEWSLISPAQQAQRWKIGGLQHLAIHQVKGWLYSLVHQGGEDSHKQDGSEIWIYDLVTRERINRLKLETEAASIQVSQDDQPLLYAATGAIPALFVYDAVNGNFQRRIDGVGFNPMLLQTFQ